MKVIKYGGKDYLLSGWNYTDNNKLSQRSWVCPEEKVSAIIIVRKTFGYAFLVSSPDGEMLDVGVCRTRGDCKKMSQRVIDHFVGHCSIGISEYSRTFRDWIQ